MTTSANATQVATAHSRSSALDARQRHIDRRPIPDRLIDDAVPFGELEQLIELILRRVGFEIEAQTNLRKANRRIFGNAQRTTEIKIAFR